MKRGDARLYVCVDNAVGSISLTLGTVYVSTKWSRDEIKVRNDNGDFQAYRRERFTRVEPCDVVAIIDGKTYDVLDIPPSGAMIKVAMGEPTLVKYSECKLVHRDYIDAEEPSEVNVAEAIEVDTNDGGKVIINADGIYDGEGNSLMPTWELSKDTYTGSTDIRLANTGDGEVLRVQDGGLKIWTDEPHPCVNATTIAEEPKHVVNILGQDYKIFFRSKARDPYLAEALGYTDFYTKEIVIADDLESYGATNDANRNKLINNHTIRHELVHAYFFESGLDGSSEYARNEELVDWIAIQLPKMFKSMEETIKGVN